MGSLVRALPVLDPVQELKEALEQFIKFNSLD